MNESSIFSSPEQITKLADVLAKYIRLPFSTDTIPGAVLEGALAFCARCGSVENLRFC